MAWSRVAFNDLHGREYSTEPFKQIAQRCRAEIDHVIENRQDDLSTCSVGFPPVIAESVRTSYLFWRHGLSGSDKRLGTAPLGHSYARPESVAVESLPSLRSIKSRVTFRSPLRSSRRESRLCSTSRRQQSASTHPQLGTLPVPDRGPPCRQNGRWDLWRDNA